MRSCIGTKSPSTQSHPYAAGFGGPIDLLRLRVTAVGGSAMIFDNINLSTAAVPEPATLALFGLGLAAATQLRRRSRRA
jgi:PEP-CTERM motif